MGAKILMLLETKEFSLGDDKSSKKKKVGKKYFEGFSLSLNGGTY